MWQLLNDIKSALEGITELDTVKIGKESGISAKDVPAARIVREFNEPDPINKYFDRGEIHILVLLDLKNDFKEVQHQTTILEQKIRDELKSIVDWKITIDDEDTMTVFKGFLVRFSYRGIRNTKEECQR